MKREVNYLQVYKNVLRYLLSKIRIFDGGGVRFFFEIPQYPRKCRCYQPSILPLFGRLSVRINLLSPNT